MTSLARDSGGTVLWEPPVSWWIKWVFILHVVSTLTSAAAPTQPPFAFTYPVYNATIPENSVGKTYVQSSRKMGIYVHDKSLDMSYSITKRDDDLIFKLEELRIEDFWFLRIRTNTGVLPGKLNRELRNRYQLRVKAVGQSLAGLIYEAEATVYITILDTNDLSPIFYNPSYNVTISEDTPLHSSIIEVSASDADLGVNAEIYYSFVDATSIFAIHPTTGVVTLTRPLNYQDQHEHQLWILANDRGAKTSTQFSKSRGRAKLTISVQQVNLYAPEVYVENLPALIEHGNIGTVYAIVHVEDKDSGVNGEIKKPQIIDGDPDEYFTLRPGKTPGEFLIIVRENLDREDSPDGFNLTLFVSDSGTPNLNTSVVVPVDIEDMNDNSPVFAQDVYEAKVEENALTNTPILFVNAGDADLGKNAKVQYFISSGNDENYFKMDAASGLISVASALDAEQVSKVELLISAEDEANTGSRKSGTAVVKITIQDCNDNTPVFNSTDDVFYIEENSPVGSEVGQVTATDRDSDENGYLSMTIANVNHVPFEIDPFTGVLRTKAELDYESMREKYILKIRASDWGSPFRREAETEVAIKVRDMNDNKPKFEHSSCVLYVSMEAVENTELLVVSAIDFDLTNIVTYNITEGNDDNRFVINPERGNLQLNVPATELRNEKVILTVTADDGVHSADPMFITVIVVDKGHSYNKLTDNLITRSCTATNATKVLEEMLLSKQKDSLENKDLMSEIPDPYLHNEHAPVFDNNMPAEVSVDEDSPIGFSVIKLPVEDQDPGYNGKLVFVVVEGNKQGLFSISSEGVLYVLSKLDREIQDRHELVILAADLGYPNKSATRNVSVVVLDKNDCSPKFERNHYTMNVSENVNINATITQVYATDEDKGKNAEITYSIISDTEEFKVDPQTGIIRVNGMLDRERQETYSILVQAKDGGIDPSLTSTTTVTIAVTDINDNLPKFSPEVYDIKIREDLPVGAVVTMLTAYDPDIGNGGKVKYSLIYGTDDKFVIDEETGTVRIAQKLDFEQKQVYNITAQAEDQGASPLLSSCFINIEVIDVNENLHPPVFKNFVAIGYVKENESIGTGFMQVSASDADALDNDTMPVTYSIRDGSGLGRFTIDNNGTIYTAQVLDRETVSHYWLTVYAQDKGLVPLYAHQEVLIRINDTNDNVPQTVEPLYNASVPENSGPDIGVIRIQAYDLDTSLEQNLTFEITGGNSEGYFKIDQFTGQITTTENKLNREYKDLHTLTVTVKDNGVPNLSSSTQVAIHVEDENDHAPEFISSPYRLQVPASVKGSALFRIMAKDIDVGTNAEIIYSIKRKKKKYDFSIDPDTGIISCEVNLQAGSEYDFVVKATDKGVPSKKSTAKVKIKVVNVKNYSPNPPIFNKKYITEEVLESDAVGKWIVLVQAFDPDRDKIWYSIVDGNEDYKFSIRPEDGLIFVARTLDSETQDHYNITIRATDGLHEDFAWLYIKVLNVNDNSPVFTQKEYIGEVYESAAIGKTVLQVSATDPDPGRLFYSIDSATNSASKQKFHIDSEKGIIKVNEKLDREALARHELVVMVRDQGLPLKRNMCRVIIKVLDNNDHRPKFLSDIFEGRVFETAAIGTSILQVVATDQDKGKNAEIRYSIISGNIGRAFAIDETMGTISVVKELDREGQSEYLMTVLASDFGVPSLSSTGTVRVFVTVSNNAPPKFPKTEYVAEMYEDEPVGVIVTSIRADSRSSVVYKITNGNTNDMFMVNPNSGVVSTHKVCDYEQQSFYNLTITATNIIGRSANCLVLIHVIDKNDNNPVFEKENHSGIIIEMAPIGSIVLNEANSPLVIRAVDRDTGVNSLIQYEITEPKMHHFFSVDISTGTVRTAALLDYENTTDYEFTVRAYDMGRPRLLAIEAAMVRIHILDTNDSPPEFSEDFYNVTLLLPTFKEVAVVTLNATDPDTGVNSPLIYSIISGNEDGKFEIEPRTGIILVTNDTDIDSQYNLTASVTDGKHHTFVEVFIRVQRSDETSLVFTKSEYVVDVQENLVTNQSLLVLQLTGLALNEHVIFDLLNPNDMFTIGRTSGVLHTVGKPFDRELRSSYKLVVEAKDSSLEPRFARTIVHVKITDVNDNQPIFVNQPYNSVVSVESKVGDLVKKVSAVDKDEGKNRKLRYRITSGNREGLFSIEPASGRILVKKELTDFENKDFQLTVEARDDGEPVLFSRCKVPIKVITEATPLFEKQFYNVSIPENIELHTPILSLQAVSPNGQKLVYSITNGDIYNEFTVDFNTGILSVVDTLDYEKINSYNLTIQAADVITGTFMETSVSINLIDINDCRPNFLSERYIASVSEAILVASSVTKVEAKDDDVGVNQLIRYTLAPAEGKDDDRKYFQIDPKTGVIQTKLLLDHEVKPVYYVAAVATDSGIPPLSSSVLVSVNVLDLNDNAPHFPQYYYDVVISDQASRGQFVTKLLASDKDNFSENSLVYSIAGGNSRQTFQINPESGIISLSQNRQPSLQAIYNLNVSVNDGVFTSYTRVRVSVRSSNHYPPVFTSDNYEYEFQENYAVEMLVGTVTAVDKDTGYYSMLNYSITSQVALKYFRVDPDTGEIFSLIQFDREKVANYYMTVAAQDNGGRMGFATVHIRITDQNDNLPQFTMHDYKACIFANATEGSEIIQIKAEDTDEGDNGKIVYSLYPGEDTEVTDLFIIDSNTGVLSVKSNLSSSENKVHQFFVSATDQGKQRMENNVPLEIVVMGAEDIPPRFDKEKLKNQVFHVSENSMSQSEIFTVTASGPDVVDYTLHSGYTENTNNPACFAITTDGKVRLVRSLDREMVKDYTITIQALTQTSPPLVDQVELHIRVNDSNDNSPMFESNPYSVTVAENTLVGTVLVNVHADDKDEGDSGRVTYTLSEDMVLYTDRFSLDSRTGMLKLISPLDREEKEEYNLTIIAKDHGSTPLISYSHVIVKVTDVNDERPVFGQKMYLSSVNEDAAPGTVIITIQAHDKDLGRNNMLTYHITKGDRLGQFRINNNGEIIVNKELDRERKGRYELVITVTDGKFVSTTRVRVDILDANDNDPICNKTFVSIFIKEDDAPSTFLKLFRAHDKDEKKTRNSRIKYHLSGENSDMFSMGLHTGVLTIKGHLDREQQSEYRLQVHAVDGGGRSCTTEVLISIKDVNDNAPQFSNQVYKVSIPEDSKINTLITKLSATDKDAGINKQIKFRLKNPDDNFLKIDVNNGIISLTKMLDREVKDSYNVTVVAYDKGFPRLSSSATLNIKLLDVNDNPPEFEHTIYMAEVREDNGVGTSVVRVLATSKDAGVNAEIDYSIVSGNDKQKFRIHKRSGVIFVNKPLDYETTKEYFLTIQAIDGGTPPLSNTAVVTINVTDINDNPPRFAQDVYSVQILESEPVGNSSVQIVAVDSDSASNALVTYSISSGDIANQFDINPEHGILVIKTALDREKISSYVLQVEAVDSGFPTLTGTATLSIEILDVNDSPPRFSQPAYSTSVQEDREHGYSIIKFDVTDDDLKPNGGPFSFNIISGLGREKFRIDNDGTLRSYSQLDQKIKDRYELTVRAYDNGSPQLYSDATVTIEVTEESTVPPEISKLEIAINSYQDKFPGGIIGKVSARDDDLHDTLKFKIVSQNLNLFDIHEDDGRIIAKPGLDAGRYVINVSVSDGKYYSYGMVMVDVTVITEDMVKNSVTIRLGNVKPDQFLRRQLRDFLKVLKNEMSIRSRDIEIIGLQPADRSIEALTRPKRSTSDDLDVLFAVKKSHNSYMRGNLLRRRVQNAIPKIQAALRLKVLKVFSDVCEKDTCEIGTCIGLVEIDKEHPGVTEIGGRSFVLLKHQHTYECQCQEDKCIWYLDPCVGHQCPHYKVCKKSEMSGPQCVCPDGKTGIYCDEDARPDCAETGCRHDNRPMTFAGRSYARWTLVDKHGFENRLSVSMKIKTRQKNANLMFASGTVDYSILELYDGMVQYRFECGSGVGRVQLPRKISDGDWHTIFVERMGNTATINLDGRYTAWSSAPGEHDVLNLGSNNVYFGAEVETFPNGFRNINKGFEGCMEDLRLHNVRLPFTDRNAVATSQEFHKIEFNCRDNVWEKGDSDPCSNFPCLNGGQCITKSRNGYTCVCAPRFQGNRCEVDTNPCADNPCLNGGTCRNNPVLPNDFWCKCVGGLKGRRCEYGYYCATNPCKNGANCIEGPDKAICQCVGHYEGPLCEYESDKCAQNPCKNGGTCYNGPGSYFCNCSSDTKGTHCEEILLPNISSNRYGITQKEIIIIIGAVSVLFVIVILLIGVRFWYQKKQARRRPPHSRSCLADNVIRNSAHDELKSHKLSNTELHLPQRCPSPQPPPVPNRPASYTPSNHDSVNTLNNFDAVRNYGSAADQLENPHNIPVYTFDHLQTFTPYPRNCASIAPSLPPPPPSNSASDTDSIQKPHWDSDYPNILENYPECYHWDTSDWAPNSALPNISELPVKEVLDSPSSSPQSNDSNTHVDPPNMEDVNDAEMDDHENDSEYVGDSECTENFDDMEENEDPNADYRPAPNFQHFLGLVPFVDDEDNQHGPQNHHPNIMPDFGQIRQNGILDNWPAPPGPENGNDGNNSDEDENGEPYPLPRHFRPRLPVDDYEHSAASMIDDMSVSFGGYTSTNASCSDISGLCDIEDSEMNLSDESDTELHPAKFSSAHLHTQV